MAEFIDAKLKMGRAEGPPEQKLEGFSEILQPPPADKGYIIALKSLPYAKLSAFL